MQTNSSICICAYFTLLCLKVTRLSKNYHFLLEEREMERERQRDSERETEEGERFKQQILLSQRAVRFPKLQIMTFSLVGGGRAFWLSSTTDVMSWNLVINHSISLFFTSYNSTLEAVPGLSSCIFMMDLGHVLRRGHQSLLAQQGS